MEGCQNLQNTRHFFFLEKKKEKKIVCKDLGIGRDLREFPKIPTEG